MVAADTPRRTGLSVRQRTDFAIYWHQARTKPRFASATGRYCSHAMDCLQGSAEGSLVPAHNERNRNSDAIQATCTRVNVDCRRLHLCVGRVGYRCNRPHDPGLVRQYSRRARAVQAGSSYWRLRGRASLRPASAPHRSAGYHQPPKPGAVPRLWSRRIDAANRAFKPRRQTRHCRNQDRGRCRGWSIRQRNRRSCHNGKGP